VLKEELWSCREQMQEQAEFCTGLGAASCTVLWSASGREQAVADILADVTATHHFVCFYTTSLVGYLILIGRYVNVARACIVVVVVVVATKPT